MDNYFTSLISFYGNTSPRELIKKYGSPLYVYNESILRQRCREMYPWFHIPVFSQLFLQGQY